MKVKERSPTRLRLVHFGWYYAAIAGIFGLLCLYATISLLGEGNYKDAAIFFFCGVGMSVGISLIATRRVEITLDREAGTVEVRNATAFGKRLRTAPFDQLHSAHMETSRTGDTHMHRLVLQFHDRPYWLVTKMYTSGDGTTHAIGMINDWLEDPEAAARVVPHAIMS